MFTPEQKAKFSDPNTPVYMTSQEGEALATAGLITADPAQKDPSNASAFLVTLTTTGQQALATPAQPPAAPATSAVPPAAPVAQAPTTPPATPPVATEAAAPASGVGYDAVAGDNISPVETGYSPAPPKKRGGNTSSTRKSSYNYDGLEAPVTNPADGTVSYHSFHVAPKEGETIEALVKRMSSNTSAANRRYRDYVMDGAGQTVMEEYDKRTFTRDAEGGYVLDDAGKRTSTVEKKTRPKTVQTRKFIAQEAQESDKKGPGVRVYRVALD